MKVKRRAHCLYITFSKQEAYTPVNRATIGVILPYIDAALRQVSHLPAQTPARPPLDALPLDDEDKPGHTLTSREVEIMYWVALGKTNPEIGSILNISEFTAKNHMQRVFKKLDVSNRAQAVSKFRALCD